MKGGFIYGKVNTEYASETFSRGSFAFNGQYTQGTAAGQTVPHLHVHLIPRFTGDRKNPRGGVRWVIPDKADFWSPR